MTFDIQEILKFLPHRYPFLLIDRIIEFEPTKRLVAIKNVTINEPFFQGHFPGYPIMPGVLVVGQWRKPAESSCWLRLKIAIQSWWCSRGLNGLSFAGQ